MLLAKKTLTGAHGRRNVLSPSPEPLEVWGRRKRDARFRPEGFPVSCGCGRHGVRGGASRERRRVKRRVVLIPADERVGQRSNYAARRAGRSVPARL